MVAFVEATCVQYVDKNMVAFVKTESLPVLDTNKVAFIETERAYYRVFTFNVAPVHHHPLLTASLSFAENQEQGLMQLEDIMGVAQRSRSVASTAMNAQSSRSHSVFTLWLTGADASTGTTLRVRLESGASLVCARARQSSGRSINSVEAVLIWCVAVVRGCLF